MYGDDRPRHRRQRRGGAGCEAGLRGSDRRQPLSGGEGRRLTGSPATRTFLALATSAAQDLRDRDGIARPLLRRGALRLTTSPSPPVRRLGAGYLRVDPPTPEEVARSAPLPRRTDAPPIDRTETAAAIGGADVERRALLPAPRPEEPADPGDDETPDPTGRETPR